jgi:hypothetical protein
VKTVFPFLDDAVAGGRHSRVDAYDAHTIAMPPDTDGRGSRPGLGTSAWPGSSMAGTLRRTGPP